jgi:hypothetical protein
VYRDVAGAFDHHLYAMGFGDYGQLTERAQLGELGFVVGVGDRPGSQPVTEGERDVVAGQDLAQLREVRVEERLGVMRQAPGRHDRATPADDAGDSVDGERDAGKSACIQIPPCAVRRLALTEYREVMVSRWRVVHLDVAGRSALVLRGTLLLAREMRLVWLLRVRGIRGGYRRCADRCRDGRGT